MSVFPDQPTGTPSQTPAADTNLHASTLLDRNALSNTSWYIVRLAAGANYRLEASSTTQLRCPFFAIYGESATDRSRVRGVNNASDRNPSQTVRFGRSSGGNSAADWTDAAITAGDYWLQNLYIANIEFDHVQIQLGNFSSETACRGCYSVRIRNCKFVGCVPRALTLSLARDVLIEGCEFDTIFANDLASDGLGVYMSRCKNVYIRRCRFIDCSSDGIQIQHPDSVWYNSNPSNGLAADLSNFFTLTIKNLFQLNAENIHIEDCEFISNPFSVVREKFITRSYTDRMASSTHASQFAAGTPIGGTHPLVDWGENAIDIKQTCGPVYIRRCRFRGYNHRNAGTAYGRSAGQSFPVLVHGYGAQNVRLEECEFVGNRECIRILTRRPSTSHQHIYTNKVAIVNNYIRAGQRALQVGAYSTSGRNNGIRGVVVAGNKFANDSATVLTGTEIDTNQIQVHHRFREIGGGSDGGHGTRQTQLTANWYEGNIVRCDPFNQSVAVSPAHSSFTIYGESLFGAEYDSQHAPIAQSSIIRARSTLDERADLGICYLSEYSEQQKEPLVMALRTLGLSSVELDASSGLTGAQLRNEWMSRAKYGVIVVTSEKYDAGAEHPAWTVARWSLPDFKIFYCGITRAGLLMSGLQFTDEARPPGDVSAWNFGTASNPKHEAFKVNDIPCEYDLPNTYPNNDYAQMPVHLPDLSDAQTYHEGAATHFFKDRFGQSIATSAATSTTAAVTRILFRSNGRVKSATVYPCHPVDGISGAYLSVRYHYMMILPPIDFNSFLSGLICLVDALGELGIPLMRNRFAWEYLAPLAENPTTSRAEAAKREKETIEVLLQKNVQPLFTLTCGGRDRNITAYHNLRNSNSDSQQAHLKLLQAKSVGMTDYSAIAGATYSLWQASNRTYSNFAIDNHESWGIVYEENRDELESWGFDRDLYHYCPIGTISGAVGNAFPAGVVLLSDHAVQRQFNGRQVRLARSTIEYPLEGLSGTNFEQWRGAACDQILHAWLTMQGIPSIGGHSCHHVDMGEINSDRNPPVFIAQQAGHLAQLANSELSRIEEV